MVAGGMAFDDSWIPALLEVMAPFFSSNKFKLKLKSFNFTLIHDSLELLYYYRYVVTVQLEILTQTIYTINFLTSSSTQKTLWPAEKYWLLKKKD